MNDPIKRTAAAWHEAGGIGGDVSPLIEALRVASMSFAEVDASAAEIWMAEVVGAANQNRLRFLAERPGNYAEALRDLVERADTFVVVWRDGALPSGNDLAVLKGAPMMGKVDAVRVPDRKAAEAVARMLKSRGPARPHHPRNGRRNLLIECVGSARSLLLRSLALVGQHLSAPNGPRRECRSPYFG